MIVCICNNISETDLARDPQLITQCGTQCGSCCPLVEQFNQQSLTVYVTDSDYSRFEELHTWAQQCCSSYEGIKIKNVSDIMPNCNELAEFRFAHLDDAALFRLRWNKSQLLS